MKRHQCWTKRFHHRLSFFMHNFSQSARCAIWIRLFPERFRPHKSSVQFPLAFSQTIQTSQVQCPTLQLQNNAVLCCVQRFQISICTMPYDLRFSGIGLPFQESVVGSMNPTDRFANLPTDLPTDLPIWWVGATFLTDVTDPTIPPKRCAECRPGRSRTYFGVWTEGLLYCRTKSAPAVDGTWYRITAEKATLPSSVYRPVRRAAQFSVALQGSSIGTYVGTLGVERLHQPNDLGAGSSTPLRSNS